MPDIIIYTYRILNKRYQFWIFWLEVSPQRLSNGEITNPEVAVVIIYMRDDRGLDSIRGNISYFFKDLE